MTHGGMLMSTFHCVQCGVLIDDQDALCPGCLWGPEKMDFFERDW